jgi:hypothetical protein
MDLVGGFCSHLPGTSVLGPALAPRVPASAPRDRRRLLRGCAGPLSTVPHGFSALGDGNFPEGEGCIGRPSSSAVWSSHSL